MIIAKSDKKEITAYSVIKSLSDFKKNHYYVEFDNRKEGSVHKLRITRKHLFNGLYYSDSHVVVYVPLIQDEWHIKTDRINKIIKLEGDREEIIYDKSKKITDGCI